MNASRPQSDDPAGQRPIESGYRWPAEWEPHAATWLSWPHNRDTWPGKFDVIPAAYTSLALAIARFEPVQILAAGAARDDCLRRLEPHLAESPHPLSVHDIPTNDAWVRDHGPTFLQAAPGAQPALIDWQYNAWAGKYPPFDLDNAVPARLAKLLDFHRFSPGMVLEGGAIESDGAGTLLTTRSCLLHPGRNPTMDEPIVEQYLRQYLGAEHVVWLAGDGIVGDDTDGHIDQLARLVNHRTIAAGRESDPNDENYEPLEKLWFELTQARTREGQPFELVPLPTPRPKYFQEHRLPASYCNFYLVNGGLIVPQFDDPADAVACEILGELFPDREVCPVDMLDLVWGLGAVHCLTQQQCLPQADAPSS